eukprot:scaffold133780_cov87-Phaeocystis_antarctica.AAC.1
MGARSGDMDTPEPLSPSLSPNDATRCAVSVIVGFQHSAVVDTTPGGSVNEETASLARELSAVCLSVSVCVRV